VVGRCPNPDCGSRQIRRANRLELAVSSLAQTTRQSCVTMQEAANELRVLGSTDLANLLDRRIAAAQAELETLSAAVAAGV